MGESGVSPTRNVYLRFQQILVGVALVFMVLLLRNQWGELSRQPWRLNVGWLAISTIFLLISWGLEIKIWQRLLALMGSNIAYGPAIRIWFLSAMTRYVPGNIWQPLSMTMRCQKRGVRPETTIASVLLFQLMILMAAGPVAALYLGLFGNYGMFTTVWQGLSWGRWTPLLLCLLLLPIVVFILRPNWFFGLANWGLARIGRPPLDNSFSTAQLFGVLVLTFIHWLCWGLCFGALTFSLQTYTYAEMAILAPHLIASFPIAYAVGFLSFITPSGFGVREGALYFLLAPLMGGGPATVAALAMRIWPTVGELAMALISWSIEERYQRF
ncbi:MAG: lysylphosphatidylglycerol synthase transmembrane domain-containing protein [Chloroflexota bacterium]